jgi:hypothetical protein
MLRKPAFFALGIFLWLLLPSQVYGINQLQNADFENAVMLPWEATSVTGTTDNNEKQSGNQSLKISTTKTSFYYVKQRISGVNLNKQYKISSYIKKGNNLKIKIAWYESGGGGQIGNSCDESDAISPDIWSLLQYDVIPRSNASEMEIRLSIASTNSDTEATAYFDSISVVESDPPTPMPTETPSPTSTITPPGPIDTPRPTSTPTKTPTPAKTPTPKKTSTPSKTPTPTKKLSPSPTKKITAPPTASNSASRSGGKVLGEEAKVSTSSSFVSQQSDEFVQIFVLIGVLFGAASAAAYFYNKFQTPIDKFVSRKFKKE